ncbi:Uncharacterized protein family UPF0564 [Lotmaria passim]
MEEMLTVQLHKLREEQHRLEQLLGHNALGTSCEASAILRYHALPSAPQQRCVRELGVHDANTAAVNADTIASDPSSAAKATATTAEKAEGQTQWTYQDRLKELESLKKKYEEYARASMSQYFNSVSDYEGYQKRREERMKHVQPFKFESRELMKPPRIREQRAEADRRACQAAAKGHPLKARPVPPSTFMNKYELMVEEWCQRKAAIELMSRERARLAKEETEYVRLSAQSLRKTREELMGVVYGADGRPMSRSEQQRRRAQSAEARLRRHHNVNEVPLEVKMKLWPALSDHERVRKERIKYRAALRKVEVDEEVRQVLPLLTSPTPGRCYDAVAGVNAVLLPVAGTAVCSVGVVSGGGGGGPCFGVGQAIHPPVATGAAAIPAAAVAVSPLPPAPPSGAAGKQGSPLPPTPLTAPVVPPPPGVAVPLPPTPLTTSTAAVVAVPPAPACVVVPPPSSAAVPNSLAPHQSLSLLSTSTVNSPPLGVGAAGEAPAVPVPGATTTALASPLPPPLTVASSTAVKNGDGGVVSSGSSPSPLFSVVPSSVVSPESPSLVAAKSAARPPSSATPPPPPLPPPAAVPPPIGTSPSQVSGGLSAPLAAASVPPPPPASNAMAPSSSPPPLSAVPPPPVPASALPANVASTFVNAGSGSAAADGPVGALSAKVQEDKEAIRRRYNPQLTFKPNVKPGVPDFEALWAKNKAELAAKKKTHPTTKPKPFDLTPSARAAKVVGRRPTRSVSVTDLPARPRSVSQAKKSDKSAGQDAASKPASATQRSSSSAAAGEVKGGQQTHTSVPRGTRAHALRTEAIYSHYVKESEAQNKVAEEDEQYWKAVAQRQREVRQRLSGYIVDHHLEHELTIKSKVRALRAAMKENEKAAEERLAEMRQRVAEMPPVFAEPVHLHEESKARAEAERNILQSLKDTGLDGATIKTILATSASNAEKTEGTDDAAAHADAVVASPSDAASPAADDAAKAEKEGNTDATHSPTSTIAKEPQKDSKKSSKKGSNSSSTSSSSGSSDSDDNSSSSSSSSGRGSSSSASSRKKGSSTPPRGMPLVVSSIGAIPVPKPVTPKKDEDYSEDSFEDSSDDN